MPQREIPAAFSISKKRLDMNTIFNNKRGSSYFTPAAILLFFICGRANEQFTPGGGARSDKIKHRDHHKTASRTRN